MATEIGKATKLKLSLETLITVGATVVVVTTMYLTLKSEIAVAKELPKSEITRIEYELKDELIRNTILKTQDDINKITKTLERIEDKVYDR
jgi:Mg2+ and Co2+ transporter CorA